MQIVLYPDPVLRAGSKPIEDPGPAWEGTARAMLDLMYDTEGVGLAAPQVGLSVRLLVLNPSGDREQRDQEMVLVNPQIASKKGKEWGREGCLSFPGIWGEVQRATRIVVKAVDPKGAPIELVAEDFLARVIQHEMDHLEGIVFIDRFSPAEKIKVRSQIEELEERWRQKRAAAGAAGRA